MTDSIAYGAEPSRPSDVPESSSLVRRLLDLDSDSPDRSNLSRLFGVRALSPAARRAFSTARTDVSVARELARLGRSWTVYRCVGLLEGIEPSSRVIVGPGGVFLINSVEVADEDVWVDDFVLVAGVRRLSRVDQTKKAARAVSAALALGQGNDVLVTPVIVLTAARSVTYANESTRVLVLGIERLSRWISQRPARLRSARIAQIRAALDHGGTGASLTFVQDDTVDLAPDFDVIAARVHAAQRQMVVWIEVAAVAVVAAALLVSFL